MTEYKLSDICKIINGRAYRQHELLAAGKYPILRVGNFFTSDRWYYSDMELPADKYCDKGDLLFAWSASFGAKIWDGGKVIYHYHIWKIVPDEALVDKYYLFYWLKYSVESLTAGTHGSVMAHMTKEDMESKRITLPSLTNQKKISSVLRVIDEKITINKQINDNLSAQIKTLCALWMNEHETAEWKEYSLSQIADFYGGYSYTSSELQDSDVAMATIKNFDRHGGFKLDGFKEIIPSEKLKASHKASVFDTLVAHTDLTQNAEVIGNAEMLMSTAGYSSIIYSMDLVKVIPKQGTISKFLLAALLQMDVFKQHCLAYVNGTTVLHLSKKALPNYTLLLPNDLSDLSDLDAVVSEMYKQIASNIDENIKLEQLRTCLLPKLMSGEVDVSEIDF